MFFSPLLTFASVWNIGETGDIYSNCYEIIMFGQVTYARRRCKARALSVYITHILYSMGSCSLRSNERTHFVSILLCSFTRVICYDQLTLQFMFYSRFETCGKSDSNFHSLESRLSRMGAGKIFTKVFKIFNIRGRFHKLLCARRKLLKVGQRAQIVWRKVQLVERRV